MALNLSSSLLGESPEDDLLLSELRRSGPEGRPATPIAPSTPVASRIAQALQGPISMGLGDIAAGFKGKSPTEFPSRVAKKEQLEQSILRAKAPQILIETAKGFQDLGLTGDQAKKAADFLSQSASEIGFDLPPEVFVESMRNPGGIEALAAKFPDILKLPKESRTKLLTDPGFLKTFLGIGAEDRPKADFERVGLELFSKSTGFTSEEAAKINEVIQKRRVEVSAATGAAGVTAKAEAEENLPLNEKAPLWMNPNTGEPAKPSDTLKTAKDKGFVPVNQQGLQASATAKAALAQLKEYRELGKKLLVKKTGNDLKDAASIQSNRINLMMKRLAGDPDAKRLEGLFGGIATLARATGDTANIAVAEREFLKNFALTDSDSFESGMEKLNQAERILRAVVEGRGVPLPGTAPARPGEKQPEAQFKSPDDVRSAFQAGKLTKQHAAKILKDQFGFD